LSATPVRHDNDNYGASFIIGRANLSSVKRYDVTVADNSQWTASSVQYNTAGGIVKSIDPLGHFNTTSYADSFSDGNNNRNALAYPKIVTDADGYSSTKIYNFDFGSVTSYQTPQPNTIQNLPGPVQTFAYDSAARLERVTQTTNGAYIRYLYGPNYAQSFSTVNTVADEGYAITVFDGLGRTFLSTENHPGSVGGYSTVHHLYDLLGQPAKQSNPTETNGYYNPAGDDAAGWLYVQQTYDWKGRPLRTTNTDGMYKEASYSGCGCAGGEVVALTDEGTIDPVDNTAKRRQQKIYSDVLGRTVKTEVLNWQGGSVYSTTINNYNAQDQIIRSRQFDAAQGTVPEDVSDLTCPNGSCQQTTLTYDGYGRLKTKHVPEQSEDAVTTYNYNGDDTPSSVVDARGASQTFSYNNNRQLLSGITYSAPAGIPTTPNISFAYDAVGNRTSMTDGLGFVNYVYSQLSRLNSEARTFSDPGTPINNVTKTIGYDYNLAGELKSITDATGATINYGFDSVGRLSAVNGSSFGGVTSYASGTAYRAWGAPRHLGYGNGKAADLTFNQRMQPLSLTIPGVMAKTYDYYADGQLRFSSDLLDHKFDRFYGYDHNGRITEGLSGAEARGEGATTARPYNETFSFDAFSHLTTRTSLNWNVGLAPTSDSYQNNRRTGWDYDAEGNLLNGSDGSYSYDAAGDIRTVGSYDPVSTTTRVLDGHSQQIKTTEVTYHEDTSSWVTTVKYYLRSTVLKGQVLSELDSSGAKTRTFVYAAGTTLAWQQYVGSNEEVLWENRDASGASFRMVDVSGDPWNHLDEAAPAELDPVGANAGIHAPLINEPPPENGGSLLSYPQFTDMRSGLTRSFAVDGIPVPMDYFMQQLDFAFHGSLGLAQAVARASRGQFRDYSVRLPDGRSFSFGNDRLTAESFAREMGVNTIQRNWLVSDWSFSYLPPTSSAASRPVSQDLDPYLIKINHAFGDAGRALSETKGKKKDPCLEFFTQGRSLKEVQEIFKNFWQSAAHDANEQGLAGTTNSGGGMAAYVKLGNAFFLDEDDGTRGTDLSWSPVNKIYTTNAFSLTPRQNRALTILHEFAHALGLIPRDNIKVDPTGAQSKKNDATIYNKCGHILDSLPWRD
jgi:YD repeat-containing protein